MKISSFGEGVSPEILAGLELAVVVANREEEEGGEEEEDEEMSKLSRRRE